MAVRLISLTHRPAGRHLSPERFLVHISAIVRVELRAIVRLEELGQLKKSNNLIGDRNRDLPACSTVPQPTMLSRALVRGQIAYIVIYIVNIMTSCRLPRGLGVAAKPQIRIPADAGILP
jgi:hypothetical protein